MKDLLNNFTDFIVSANNSTNISKIYETDYFSLQISSSISDIKAKADQAAIFKNLSLIDFSSCEQHLKDINVIKQNDSLRFSKIDWNADTKSNSLINENITNLDSISYSLYTLSGEKIDMNLCKDTTTTILMHIGDFNISLNTTGYNPYDVSDDYYNDQCRPMLANDTSATLNDKRNSFPDLNYTCSQGCTYQKINVSNGYLSCNCNSSLANSEIAPEYGKVILNILNSTNIFILECYHTFLLYVNNSLIFLA